MGNAQALFEAIRLGGDRQNARILRLSFPHDDGPSATLLANRLEADEGLSRDFTYTLEILAEDANILLEDVMGKMVTISLVRADGSVRFFNGYVFQFQLVKTDGSLAFYSMVLKPWLAYLHIRKDNFLFHGKTLREQTESIFKDYGTHADWDYQVKAAETPVTMACQFQESDHNYLHRHWEAAGLHYWYEHSEKGHKLVLSDDSTQAAPIDGDSAEISFQRHAGAKEEDAIGEWSRIRDIHASKIALSGFNFKSPVPANVNMPTLAKQGDVLNVESYEYAGAYGFKDGQDGDGLARRRIEEIEAGGEQMQAAGNNRNMQPRRSFQLTGHFNAGTSGSSSESNEYQIVSVIHSASNNYLQQADAPANYSNRAVCIRKNVPWRPGRNFSSVDTKITTLQTATVVTPDGQDVYVDKYGRVRVQLHWDRIGENNERSSAWLRVMSPIAGAQLGAEFPLRKGMEVVVACLDGNPDRMVITGAVYNERNMPPWKLADQQALSGFRTRELIPDGGNTAGGRSNHLVFDDSNAKIQAQLKSDHLHSSLSLGYITRIEDNAGRKDARGEGLALETGGAGALRADRGLLLSTDGRAKAVGGILSRDELISCLEQALDLAKGLSQSATQHQGGARDPKPQQDLTAAIDALGHGTGPEADAKGSTAGGQPVMAFSSPAGIASATPKDQIHYAGQNIDAVAGGNLQNYAAKSILHTAGKDIEQFSVDGDIRTIANKGKIIQQAQNNLMEITADKSLTILSTEENILVSAQKNVTLTSGGAYIKIADGNIEIVCPGNLIFKSASRSFTGPGSMAANMPKFNTGDAGRKFTLHREGDKSNLVANHNYKIKLDDGQIIEGKTGSDGLTQLAQKDAMRIANIQVWKDPK